MAIVFLIPALIGLTLAVLLVLIAARGISSGHIKPFQTGRWNEVEGVQRSESPAEFWLWIVAYFALAVGAFAMAILGFAGRLKFR